MPFSPQGDLPTVIDRLEFVRLQTDEGLPLAIRARAVRRPVSIADAMASHGTLTTSDVKWHLVSDDLVDAPIVGQQIVEIDGTTWTIRTVSAQVYGTYYRCVSRRV